MCLRICTVNYKERTRVLWDGPIAGLKGCETSGFAIGILVNAKADDGHGGDACEREAVVGRCRGKVNYHRRE
jgi:hypothetical protein